jgi:hypothetical protein
VVVSCLSGQFAAYGPCPPLFEQVVVQYNQLLYNQNRIPSLPTISINLLSEP